MSLIQSKIAAGNIVQPYPGCAGEVITVRATIEATAAQLTLNNIFEMMALPDNCRVVDMTLVVDDLDSGGSPAVALDVGLMSGNFGDADDARTCGEQFFNNATTAQGGGASRMTLATGFDVAPVATTRGIGVKVAAAPATAAGGTITLIALFAVAD